MSAKSKGLYVNFGNLLMTLRQQAGIAQQSDLAFLMKTTQQTISRWELGISRPRAKQIPLLASILKADVDQLLTAAGYTANLTVATFDQPFPIDALTPESFERFCLYFLERRHPAAQVHRAGGSGHTQEGLDVEVIFPDQTCHTFQCKRVHEFGPRKIHAAVSKHTRAATKKFLLLSRVASPQARQAIRLYADWEIWDKEDISLRIRQLPKDDQLKLVDTFFRGQRLALLGETEPGPWQTSEDFFAPFMSRHGVFSHTWNLVGRDKETHTVIQGLLDRKVAAVFLVGAGGAGKSRVLKQAIEAYETAHRGVLVRFLSPTEPVTNKSLEDLGDREKVLVVDDAHDRDDLQLLFLYSAIPTNKATLLLAFRPYGLDHIKYQASNFALAGERTFEVRLDRLNLDQAKALATQVLEEFSGPVPAAEDIARFTLDCPLATVIGAQIVAKEKIYFELVKNEDAFRSTLLGKFQDIIAGEIGSKSDAEPTKKLLRVLALLQPFHPDDESIYKIVEDVERLNIPEAKRLICLLIDAGVLFNRGGKYRLSPDLLADYIIEQTCIGLQGKSTGYVERVFDVASNAHIEHLLLNLGKIDWRRANGDPSNSRLLEGVWRKLRPSNDNLDPHISAVTAVAFYQPERALGFAERLLREGKYLRELPNLIKYAAYNVEHLRRACEYLWELGKNDSRSLNQYPGHAMRILAELCAIEPDKPLECNRVVVDFGLSLLDQEDSWNQTCSPFDILEGILHTEGHTTESKGFSLSFSPYLIFATSVAKLRCSVIDATLNLLTHPKTKVAVLAAQFLQKSLHYPIRLFNMKVSDEEREQWTPEFVQTLEKIEKKLHTTQLDPLVLIALVRSVSWHAHYAQGETAPIAKRIIASLPDSLEFRATLTLIDGYGRLFDWPNLNYEEAEVERNKRIEVLTNDLLSAYPHVEPLYAFIEERLSHIAANYTDSDISPYVLYWRLLQSSSALAQLTIENALTNPESKTMQFAGMALEKLLHENRVNGLSIARRFLATDSRNLHVAVGYAYRRLDLKGGEDDQEDLAILRKILTSSTDRWVIKNAVEGVRAIAKNDQRLAIDLLKCVNINTSNAIADDVLALCLDDKILPFHVLTDDDIDHFLKQTMTLPQLEGHWIETFLSKVSKHHAHRAATFFIHRVEHAANTEDWQYRPCNYGPYIHVPLCFRESPEIGSLLRLITQWMKSRGDDDFLFYHHASKLFAVIFCPFDSETLSFFHHWLDVATPIDIRVISHILSEVPSSLVFEHRQFVRRFLDKAKQYGKDHLDAAVSALYKAAMTGMRSGLPGQPFPKDLQIKAEAEKALSELPRFSPAYHLYESLKRQAEHDIQLSILEREAFED